MKPLLIVIAFVFSIPVFVNALPDTNNFLKDDMDVDHPDELNNPARKGSILDQIRNADQPVQTRTTKKGKLSRDQNRTTRATPTQNCEPNDVQCMRSQEMSTVNPR